MVRVSVLSVLSAGVALLVRGGTAKAWYLLLLACFMTLALSHGDHIGFFDKSTGWIRGMYVDEPTSPAILKAIWFLTLLALCFVIAAS
jgi:hypothetical protein